MENIEMLEAYRQHAAERESLGIPPLPLDAEATSQLCELLKAPPTGEEDFLVHLLRDRVPPGVDQAAYVKASFLTSIAKGDVSSDVLRDNRSNIARLIQPIGTSLIIIKAEF